MKKLLVIRHCEPIFNGEFLTEHGLKQVEKLKERLLATFPIGTRFVFLSSKVGRALRTVIPLAKAVGVTDEGDIQWHDFLYSNDRTVLDPSLHSICEALDAFDGKIDVAVVVTHLEIANSLPRYWGDMVLGKGIHGYSLKRGDALLIDAATGQAEFWPAI